LLPLLANDPSPEVRAAVAVTLGRFAYMAELGELNTSDEQALRAALIGCVDDNSQPELVRRRALESAGYFGTSTPVERAIGAAYGAGDPGLRESALIAMGRSMQERWLAAIGDNLRSPTASLRYQAARAAGEFADAGETLLPRLMPLLDDDDSEVTLAAIWALGQIGGPRSKQALEQMAKSGDEAQQQAANAALIELSLDDDPLGV
jgi:HEAT repeat protein